MHVYEVRPRKDKRGVDLISDALPFGRLWFEQVTDAIEYAKFFSRSHDAVIRVYDDAGNGVQRAVIAFTCSHLHLPRPWLRLGPFDSTLSRYNVKPGTGTTILVAALFIAFGIELASHRVGNEALLLKLGALPDNGELHGEYWRLATYSFLHLNGTHLIVNAMLLFWIGRVIESRVIFVSAGAIYASSVLCSAAMILCVHHLHPKIGATMGASGGIFGLFAAALIILHREKAEPLDRESRLRALVWTAMLAGLGISLLPGISMAGHVGGLIGGAVVATIARLRTNL